jgi:myo-inositol-1(or 4)-monophosphatase
VTEAGGMVSDFKGGDKYLESGNLIAANGKMLKEMAKIIGKTIPEEFRN